MRKILIVPIGKLNEYRQMAKNNNISEIVEGIPLGLSDKYKVSDLPIIHTEKSVAPQLTEIELLQQENSTLGQMVTEAELENITQGQIITDLELRIIELEAKINV